MGHLNNKNYLGFFDQAAWHVFLALGHQPKTHQPRGLGLADVSQTVTFKRELVAGALILIRSNVAAVGGKSITVRHEMFDAEDNTLVATLLSTTVFFDLRKRKSLAIPTAVRAEAERWLAAGKTPSAGFPKARSDLAESNRLLQVFTATRVGQPLPFVGWWPAR